MLNKLKRRIPDATDNVLLQDLLDGAEEMILAYTGREMLPDMLQAVQLELAVMQFNRMGMEGETSHAEGSISRSAESLPEMIRRQLNPWRLAKAVEM